CRKPARLPADELPAAMETDLRQDRDERATHVEVRRHLPAADADRRTVAFYVRVDQPESLFSQAEAKRWLSRLLALRTYQRLRGQLVLYRAAPLAPAFVHPLRGLLAPTHIAVNLG